MTESPIRTAACAASWLVLGVYSVALFWNLGDGHLSHWDASLTAERSREMLLTGDFWTVHLNFEPNFRKPPLHYIQTAVTLQVLPDPELAVRFWSAAYAVGCFVLVAVLARGLIRSNPWAVPVTWAFLSFAFFFFHNSRLALLDSGATFFLLLTVLGVHRLRSYRSGWWPLALGIVLGSLHKAPLGIVYLVGAMLVDAPLRKRLSRRGSRHRLGAILVASALWPASQCALFGRRFVAQGLPGEWSSAPGIKPLDTLLSAGTEAYEPLIRGWGVIGIAGLAALAACILAAPLRRHLSREPTARALAVFIAGYLALLPFLDQQSQRYMLPVAPCLAIILVLTLDRVVGSRPRRFLAVAGLLVALSTPELLRFAGNQHLDRSAQVALAKRLSQDLNPSDAVFHIVAPDDASFRPHLLLFYGDLERRVYSPWWEAGGWPPATRFRGKTVRGITHRNHVHRLETCFRSVRRLRHEGEYQLFAADAYLGCAPAQASSAHRTAM